MTISRLSDLAEKAACPRLVVKVGSSLLVGKDGVRRAWLEGLVAEIAAARGRGQDVIIVSSGSIALGAATLTSGWLYAKAGPLAYLAMAALALIGFVAALIIRARWNGELLWNDDTASETRQR